MSVIKHVWRGRDNQFTLRFDAIDADGVTSPFDWSVVLTTIVRIGTTEVTVNSGDLDAPFNWYDPLLMTGEAQFMLGLVAEADDLNGVLPIELILFDAANFNGFVMLSEDKQELLVSVHENL